MQASRRRTAATGVLVALAVSAIGLACAPRWMPEDYSWIAHTTSESAAQGVPGAWVARTGLLVFGLAVLLLAGAARDRWAPVATTLHATFGVLMITAAAFSSRPWDASMPHSRVEDLIHSVAATAMGFAFAFRVLAVAVAHRRVHGHWRGLDAVAVAASVVVPLSMVASTHAAGVLQRVMFLVAYTWYAREALHRPI